MLAACFLLFTALTGCKKEEVAPAPPAPVKKAPVQAPAVVAEEKKVEYVYSPEGKRDPFKSFVVLEKKAVPTGEAKAVPLTPLQVYDLGELKLVGVILLPGKRVAMIEDPTGKGYNVKEGTLIGRNAGVAVEILKDEVVVEEKYVDEMAKTRTRKVSIKIPREQGGEGR